MKKLLWLFVIMLLIGCTKPPITEEPPKPKPTSVNVEISFVKNADESLENYKLYFQSAKDTFLLTTNKVSNIPVGKYKIYGNSIPSKMTWENRNQCVNCPTCVNGGVKVPTWITDTLTYTFSENSNIEITRKNTAKELTGSTDGCGVSVTMIIPITDCVGNKLYVSLQEYRQTSVTYTTIRGVPCTPYTVCTNYCRTWIPNCQ